MTPFIRSSTTSKSAAEAIEPHTSYLEGLVLDAIRNAEPNGLTADEGEQRTGLIHQTYSARVRELEQRGLIRKTDMRRPTRRNRPATVYRATEVRA